MIEIVLVCIAFSIAILVLLRIAFGWILTASIFATFAMFVGAVLLTGVGP